MKLMDSMRIALRPFDAVGAYFLSLAVLTPFLSGSSAAAEDTAQSVMLQGSKSAQLVQNYCIDCHSGDDPEGDFLIATAEEATAAMAV
ncbi:MAG: hypothetical protein AAF394_14800 [Planctomycetota bacterium]